MSEPECRLLPFELASGSANMAADEVLLESAAAGQASLRFYGWTEATLSLGYFQPEAVRKSDPRLATLPFVRRPSGGATLVHDQEVTYVLALPPGIPWHSGEPWLMRMHRIIARALDVGTVPIALQARESTERFDGVLCFLHFTSGDLMMGSSKIVGSAQRKMRGALLQHGAILLQRSCHTPGLPGIAELSKVRLNPLEVQNQVVKELIQDTGWKIPHSDWSAAEVVRRGWLELNKYQQEQWNYKR